MDHVPKLESAPLLSCKGCRSVVYLGNMRGILSGVLTLVGLVAGSADGG